MEKKDYNDLRAAVNLLEKPGLSVRLINLSGGSDHGKPSFIWRDPFPSMA